MKRAERAKALAFMACLSMNTNAAFVQLLEYVDAAYEPDVSAAKAIDDGRCEELTSFNSKRSGYNPDKKVGQEINKQLQTRGANAWSITAYDNRGSLNPSGRRTVTVTIHPLVCKERLP